MPAVHGENQAVEEAAAVTGRAAEQAVVVRRQPDDAAMVGEGGGRRRRQPVDPAAPPPLGGIVTRAELDRPLRAVKLDGDREAARGAMAHEVGEIRPPEATARREEGDRLEDVGLAGAIVADERRHRRVEPQVERGIVAEVREDEARDAHDAPAPSVEIRRASA